MDPIRSAPRHGRGDAGLCGGAHLPCDHPDADAVAVRVVSDVQVVGLVLQLGASQWPHRAWPGRRFIESLDDGGQRRLNAALRLRDLVDLVAPACFSFCSLL